MRAPSPLALLARLGMAAAAAGLAGCSYTDGYVQVDATGRPTAANVTSLNFLNDRGLNYSRTDGTASTTLGYSNSPNEAGTAAAFAAIGKALDRIPAVPAGAP